MTAAAPIRAESVPALPGLELPARSAGAMVRLERRATAYVAALEQAGRLNAADWLVADLVIDLARTVGLSAAGGKAAGAAMAARQLLDALDKLPALEDEAERDDWAAVVAALSPDPVAGGDDAGDLVDGA